MLFPKNSSLSCLIYKLSSIYNNNILVSCNKILKSSNEGLWLQNKRWSRIVLLEGGLISLKSKSHLPKSWFYLLQLKAFKNDQKCHLFYVKRSFRFQDI